MGTSDSHPAGHGGPQGCADVPPAYTHWRLTRR